MVAIVSDPDLFFSLFKAGEALRLARRMMQIKKTTGARR